MPFTSWKDWKSGQTVAYVEAGTEPVEEKVGIDRLNEASVDDLTQIKGIGPKTAEKILESGPFSVLSDVREHIRISDTVFNRLEEWVESA